MAVFCGKWNKGMFIMVHNEKNFVYDVYKRKILFVILKGFI